MMKEVNHPPWYEMKIPPSSPYYGYTKRIFRILKSIMMDLREEDTNYVNGDEKRKSRGGDERKTFIFVGDSITWGCCAEKPFHQVFKEKMEEKKLSVKIFNFGVPGFNTRQEYFFLEKWFKYIPATQGGAVVLGFLLIGDFVSEENFDPYEDMCFDKETGLLLYCALKIYLDIEKKTASGRKIYDRLGEKIADLSMLFSFMSYFGFGIPFLVPGVALPLSLAEIYIRISLSSYISDMQGRFESYIWNEKVPPERILGTKKWIEKIRDFARENGLDMFAIVFPTKTQIASFMKLYVGCVESSKREADECISEILKNLQEENPSSPYFVALRIFGELEIPYLDMLYHYVRYIVSVEEESKGDKQRTKFYLRVIEDLFRDEAHPSQTGHYVTGVAFFRFWLNLNQTSDL